jgi:hypothetical protein
LEVEVKSRRRIWVEGPGLTFTDIECLPVLKS